MNKIIAENFDIEFLQIKNNALNFLVQIKITCKKNDIFRVRQIISNAGINFALRNNIKEIKGIKLLHEVKLKKDDIFTEWIGFQKNFLATNQPSFSFQGIRTKFKTIRKELK